MRAASNTHVDAFSVPVDTRAPTGRTNAYVVGSERCLMVDPAARTSTLDTVVTARDVAAIAVTHTHPDHVGAVAEYARETGATVLARRPARFEAATGVEPDRQIGEGSSIETGVGSVAVVDVPGHAADHVAFELPDPGASDDGGASGGQHPAGTVLCGDLAVAEGSVVVGNPDGDMRAYLTAIRRLWARNPRRLYPGHGPAIVAGDAPTPRATLQRLIAHRLDREEDVLAAVRAGARDIDAITEAAYERELSGVRDLARATVRAHLEKLAVEGALQFDADAVTARS